MPSRPFLHRSRRRAAICALAAVSLAFFSSGDISLADERDDAVAKQDEAKRKQQEVISSLEGVSADLGQAYISLQNAQNSLSAAETALTSAETTLAEKEREQQIATDRLTTAQNSLDAVKQEADASKKTASETSDSVGEIVVSTYQGDNSVTSWSYVLSSQDVEDLNRRASAVEIGSGVQEAVLSAAEVERAQNANREARQNAATTRVGTPPRPSVMRSPSWPPRSRQPHRRWRAERATCRLSSIRPTPMRMPLPPESPRSTPPTGRPPAPERCHRFPLAPSPRTRWETGTSVTRSPVPSR